MIDIPFSVSTREGEWIERFCRCGKIRIVLVSTRMVEQIKSSQAAVLYWILIHACKSNPLRRMNLNKSILF